MMLVIIIKEHVQTASMCYNHFPMKKNNKLELEMFFGTIMANNYYIIINIVQAAQWLAASTNLTNTRRPARAIL